MSIKAKQISMWGEGKKKKRISVGGRKGTGDVDALTRRHQGATQQLKFSLI